MTSFRFHTNFTNPLKMTNLATSPTKSNYPPQTVAHPSTPASRRSATGASAPRSPMLLFSRASHPKLPLVLRLSARAWSARADGNQLTLTPLPTWLRTEHTSGQTYRVPNIQWTESLGDYLSRSLFLCDATPSHAGEVFKFAFSKFAIQTSDCKEQPTML